MSISKKNRKVLTYLEKISGKSLTLGSFLASIREGEELTQVAMAEKLEVSKQYLCDLERGRKTVSPRRAADFAEKLGYSEDQFVRLSLQDMLDREKLSFKVMLEPYRKSMRGLLAPT
jgi:transcriptional regulator with XRE-family HTH domain